MPAAAAASKPQPLSCRQYGRYPAAYTGLQDCHPEQLRLLLICVRGHHFRYGGKEPTRIRNSGRGVAGFGRYYWRGLLDKADLDYLVIFALPTVFHQSEGHYAQSS